MGSQKKEKVLATLKILQDLVETSIKENTELSHCHFAELEITLRSMHEIFHEEQMKDTRQPECFKNLLK